MRDSEVGFQFSEFRPVFRKVLEKVKKGEIKHLFVMIYKINEK